MKKLLTTLLTIVIALPMIFLSGCSRTPELPLEERARTSFIENVHRVVRDYENGLLDDDYFINRLMGFAWPTTLDNLYFVPARIAQNFFTVSHILLGHVSGSDAADKYKYIMDYINTDDDRTRQQRFRVMIDQFNIDPGMFNPRYEYVMGVYETLMVEPFTDVSRALFASGVPGATSEIFWTEFGAHIVMYTRNISDMFFTGTLDEITPENMEHFMNKTLNTFVPKTFLDREMEFLQQNRQ
ncbi:MAG: hypothetical protein FWE38_00205 [Firmicutes bacterium]|nr:hypothetical protein [Bacillota bacterium]